MSDSGSRSGTEPRPLSLYRDCFPGRAVFDTAVSHAMLRAVAAGELGESIRLYAPDNALLFSNLDARRPGYAEAVAIARAQGFEPVTRLAGGHAAVFLEQSVAFAWASAREEAHLQITERFKRLTGWILEALRGLGLDARLGEVPGEYCPGEYSVNIEGRRKVMGVGQRVIRGGAHVGGVLTVGQSAALREILIPIYRALELDFEPETAGGVADYDPSLTPELVIDALAEVLRGDGYALKTSRFTSSVVEAGEKLAPHHVPDRPAKANSFRVTGTKTVVQNVPSDGGKE